MEVPLEILFQNTTVMLQLQAALDAEKAQCNELTEQKMALATEHLELTKQNAALKAENIMLEHEKKANEAANKEYVHSTGKA